MPLDPRVKPWAEAFYLKSTAALAHKTPDRLWQECLERATNHFELADGREAYAARLATLSPKERRIEAIHSELEYLSYRPLSVKIAERERVLRAELAGLEAPAAADRVAA